MNDDLPPDDAHADVPIDDELLRAVLDGDATPAQRAAVDASPEATRRLARLRASVEAVAAPVEPLDATTVDDLISRALAESPAAVMGGGPDRPVDELAARRADRRAAWRRLGGVAAAVAAVVIVLGGVVALAGSLGGRSSSDTASSGAAADSTGTDEAGSSGAASSPTTGAPTPPDLGDLTDAAAVLSAYDRLLDAADDRSPPHGSDEGATSTSPADVAGIDAARATAAQRCSLPPVTTTPAERWSVTAVATLPGGAVIVMSNALAPPDERVLVIDVTTCEVLADRTS